MHHLFDEERKVHIFLNIVSNCNGFENGCLYIYIYVCVCICVSMWMHVWYTIKINTAITTNHKDVCKHWKRNQNLADLF